MEAKEKRVRIPEAVEFVNYQRHTKVEGCQVLQPPRSPRMITHNIVRKVDGRVRAQALETVEFVKYQRDRKVEGRQVLQLWRGPRMVTHTGRQIISIQQNF